MRSLCVVFVALSFAFACMNISFIVNLMSFSWGVVAGSFIGPYVWGLYAKWINKPGAWAGVLSGLCVVGICVIVVTIGSGFAAAKSLAPQLGVAAMAVSMAVTPVVSKFTAKSQLKADDVEKAFDQV